MSANNKPTPYKIVVCDCGKCNWCNRITLEDESLRVIDAIFPDDLPTKNIDPAKNNDYDARGKHVLEKVIPFTFNEELQERLLEISQLKQKEFGFPGVIVAHIELTLEEAERLDPTKKVKHNLNTSHYLPLELFSDFMKEEEFAAMSSFDPVCSCPIMLVMKKPDNYGRCFSFLVMSLPKKRIKMDWIGMILPLEESDETEGSAEAKKDSEAENSVVTINEVGEVIHEA